MPNYKDPSVFAQRPADGNFDKIHEPGQPTPFSGIYRCTACNFEIVSTRGHPLPPTKTCLGHSHNWKCKHGFIRWQLVAAAIHVNAKA
jgi:hypothetical protein